MRYLVDTDRVAEFLKSIRRAVALMPSLLGEGAAISIVTYAEIYEGIYYGRDPEADEAVFGEFLKGVTLLLLSTAVAMRYAAIRGDLRAKGMLIGDNDLFIAATALHHGLTLVTGNRRHFGRVPGLVLLA